MRDERAKQVIDVWKTVVGVQMHFNDIGMRIRGLFITILLALLASIGFLLDKGWSLQLWRINIQFAVLVPIFGVFGTALFYLMDRYWFHRLLKGAVNHAIQIENKYKDTIPELSLSDEIGKESFFVPKGLLWVAAKCFVSHDKFRKKGQLHSDGKLELFYKSMISALFGISILIAVFGGISLDKKAALMPIKKSQGVDKATVTPPAVPQAIPSAPAPGAAPPTVIPLGPAAAPKDAKKE
ncbi:hypothetical protein IVA95_02540 [Bradyrhizobium sp. 157]|uniref:hypothetical protein n=1 Tax=Bradyrhizobium sp. 157 TaxID=2782631 RepID=UPI001FF72088|nr:hypothetical protein [Bradyrhizobium sp. 157]MCK1636495.1 hypothetical protein [Bradyrhizobium sp. 157]